MNLQDTIAAPATASVTSALGIVRLSGGGAIDIVSKIFSLPDKKDFAKCAAANRLYYGTVTDNGSAVDEVVVGVFKSPHSFTGEDIVEITHHGSVFVQRKILELLLSNGARLADKGEFSLRAFLNGKMNLSQAEAVADLIQSTSEVSHSVAMSQLRGGYNRELKNLRQRFLKIASLLELEIDFSAEQEVFVDRNDLINELNGAIETVKSLIGSFRQGNAFKNGIPVAIAGKPNSGKSTLMNALLKDNRSIVSSTEGTTRDTVEETLTVKGINIRFIDTAGLRESDNEIEREGIKRSFQAINNSQTVLYLIDLSKDDVQSVDYQLAFLKQDADLNGKKLILVANKEDISNLPAKERKILEQRGAVFISAKNNESVDRVLDLIVEGFETEDINSKVFVSNVRHCDALKKALESMEAAYECACSDGSADLISEDIRRASGDLGQITGEITNEDVLTNIFSSFCIGK
ncbi:MAG: tRNA uridine-5-carboxymethylaminomethyl(34) synthesis GTPase MnmE [Bacteroidales bacterium]|nr:tRNA uridine-5-carboxymethylaminomethyl(34) synthesis GTPase MnmE [Bacteroidales bacterium]